MTNRRNRTDRPFEPPTPDPLAYFLTWTTYGTWLPGDKRGWVDYCKGFQLPDPIFELEAKMRMTEDVCILDDEQRRLVEETIAEHCRIRGWELHAVNCRTNHVHVVVSADRHPKEIRDQLKAWCTRKLKALEVCRLNEMLLSYASLRAGHWIVDLDLCVDSSIRDKWWTERGSARWIFSPPNLEAAIRYVLEGQ